MSHCRFLSTLVVRVHRICCFLCFPFILPFGKTGCVGIKSRPLYANQGHDSQHDFIIVVQLK